MDEATVDRAKSLCAEAAALIDGHGTFRLRILVQMVLSELEKERKAQAARRDDDRR